MSPQAAKEPKKKAKPRRWPPRRIVGFGVTWVTACCVSFVFGMLVGRQTAPIPFDIHELEKHLLSLKGDVVEEKKKSLDAYFDATNDRTHLVFHDELKDTGAAKPVPAARQRNAPKTPDGKSADSGPIKTIRRPPGLKPKGPSKTRSIAKAKPKARPGAATQAKAKTPPAASGKITIQVAALSSVEEADRMVARLKSQGFDAYQTLTRLKDKGIRIRIRVGAFSDRSAAAGSLKALREKGYKPIVVQR